MKTDKYDNTKLVEFKKLSGLQRAMAHTICPKMQGNELFRLDEKGKVIGYRLK